MKHAHTKASVCIALATAAVVAPLTWAEPTPLKPAQFVVTKRYEHVVEKRIINGVPAKQGDLPWQVALFITDPNDNATYLCGGSVIAPGWVLTAAHCIENARKDAANVTVLSGQVDLNDPKMTSATASEIIVHGSWDHKTMVNDVGSSRVDLQACKLEYSIVSPK